ncbi:hypothetical protein CL622_06895 [archaeon]|nr:hypothetical protein [archaeon]|tara:strand:- start:1266 stop:1592 length:327 start_codon:yes stop_codon:yes gene_type:complete
METVSIFYPILNNIVRFHGGSFSVEKGFEVDVEKISWFYQASCLGYQSYLNNTLQEAIIDLGHVIAYRWEELHANDEISIQTGPDEREYQALCEYISPFNNQMKILKS